MVKNLLRPPLHILVRAVIRRDDKLLLAQAKGSHNTFLPGGHLEPGESLPVGLARELWEELGLQIEVGAYLGLVEHSWEDENTTHYELNHLFEVSLPALAADKNPLSREAHLSFFWAELDRLSEHGLEPYPLRHLLHESPPSTLWATTLSAHASSASDP